MEKTIPQLLVFLFIVTLFAPSSLMFAREMIVWDPATTPYIPNDGNIYFLATSQTIQITEDLVIEGNLEIRATIAFDFSSKTQENHSLYNNGTITIKNNHSFSLLGCHGADAAKKDGKAGNHATFYNNGSITLEKGARAHLVAGNGGNGSYTGIFSRTGNYGGHGGYCDFYNNGVYIVGEEASLIIDNGTPGKDSGGSALCNLGNGKGGDGGIATFHCVGTLVAQNGSIVEINGGHLDAHEGSTIDVSSDAILKIDGNEVQFYWLQNEFSPIKGLLI